MNAMPATECRPIPETAPLDDLALPFDAATEVVCTHSSGDGSHSWPNAFYALDLANDYNQPPAIVYAAADGKAFVFGGADGKPCLEPKGNPQQADVDSCGQAWGNRIKILHQKGYFSFYVHLDRALVKTGDLVKKGQPIGVAGWTGAAGHRHLHWSVQKVEGTNETEWASHITWDGLSVPFRFKARVDGKIQTVDASTLKCAHANIGQAPANEQPHLRGL